MLYSKYSGGAMKLLIFVSLLSITSQISGQINNLPEVIKPLIDPTYNSPLYDQLISRYHRFHTQYAEQIRISASGKNLSQWKFATMLRPNPRKNSQPHIIIVATQPGLTISLGEVEIVNNKNLENDAKKIGQASVETVCNLIFQELPKKIVKFAFAPTYKLELFY